MSTTTTTVTTNKNKERMGEFLMSEKQKQELVTRDQFVAMVAEKLETTKKNARLYVDAVWEVADEILSEPNKKFLVKGFGTFSSKVAPAHKRVNNFNGEVIEVPEKIKRKVKFSSK